MSKATRELAEQYRAIVVKLLPEGMLQVLGEALSQAEELGKFAEAMNARFGRSQNQPLHPNIREMFRQVTSHQMAARNIAADIPGMIEKLHKQELDRLRAPRQGEQMWDQRANR